MGYRYYENEAHESKRTGSVLQEIQTRTHYYEKHCVVNMKRTYHENKSEFSTTLYCSVSKSPMWIG
jgi:hypothetical protein